MVWGFGACRSSPRGSGGLGRCDGPKALYPNESTDGAGAGGGAPRTKCLKEFSAAEGESPEPHGAVGE